MSVLQGKTKAINILILGWYGNDNSGDEAVLETILSAVKNIAPAANFTVFSANPSKTETKYKVDAIKKGLLKNFRATRLAIKNSQLFLVGGGTLIEDQRTAFSGIAGLYAYLLIGFFYRVPIMFFAQGIGPLNRRINRLITRVVLNNIDLITLRDEESAKLLKKIGVNNPQVFVVGDPAINIEPPRIERLQEIIRSEKIPNDKPLVALCPKANFNIETTLAELADWLVKNLHVYIIFVPMQNTGYDNDRQCSQQIIKNMTKKKSAILISNEYNPSEIKGILGKMDLVIGMRLHALIYASAENIPVLGISYAAKVKNYLEMIDQEYWSIELDELGNPEVFSKLQMLWDTRNLIKAQLYNSITSYKQKAFTTIEYTKPLILKRKV